MVVLNSNISAIALSMNGLSVPIKRQKLVRRNKRTKLNYFLPTRETIKNKMINEKFIYTAKY